MTESRLTTVLARLSLLFFSFLALESAADPAPPGIQRPLRGSNILDPRELTAPAVAVRAVAEAEALASSAALRSPQRAAARHADGPMHAFQQAPRESVPSVPGGRAGPAPIPFHPSDAAPLLRPPSSQGDMSSPARDSADDGETGTSVAAPAPAPIPVPGPVPTPPEEPSDNGNAAPRAFTHGGRRGDSVEAPVLRATTGEPIPADAVYIDAVMGNNTHGDGSAQRPYRDICTALYEAHVKDLSPIVIAAHPGSYGGLQNSFFAPFSSRLVPITIMGISGRNEVVFNNPPPPDTDLPSREAAGSNWCGQGDSWLSVDRGADVKVVGVTVRDWPTGLVTLPYFNELARPPRINLTDVTMSYMNRGSIRVDGALLEMNGGAINDGNLTTCPIVGPPQPGKPNAMSAGITSYRTSLTVKGTSFWANTFTLGSFCANKTYNRDAGTSVAVTVVQTSATLEGAVFRFNKGQAPLVHVASSNAGPGIKMVDSFFQFNFIDKGSDDDLPRGHALVHVHLRTSAVISGTEFSSNTGGAIIRLYRCERRGVTCAQVVRSSFSNALVSDAPVSILPLPGSPGPLDPEEHGLINFWGCQFTKNTGGRAGAFSIRTRALVHIANCTMSKNHFYEVDELPEPRTPAAHVILVDRTGHDTSLKEDGPIRPLVMVTKTDITSDLQSARYSVPSVIVAGNATISFEDSTLEALSRVALLCADRSVCYVTRSTVTGMCVVQNFAFTPGGASSSNPLRAENSAVVNSVDTAFSTGPFYAAVEVLSGGSFLCWTGCDFAGHDPGQIFSGYALLDVKGSPAELQCSGCRFNLGYSDVEPRRAILDAGGTGRSMDTVVQFTYLTITGTFRRPPIIASGVEMFIGLCAFDNINVVSSIGTAALSISNRTTAYVLESTFLLSPAVGAMAVHDHSKAEISGIVVLYGNKTSTPAAPPSGGDVASVHALAEGGGYYPVSHASADHASHPRSSHPRSSSRSQTQTRTRSRTRSRAQSRPGRPAQVGGGEYGDDDDEGPPAFQVTLLSSLKVRNITLCDGVAGPLRPHRWSGCSGESEITGTGFLPRPLGTSTCKNFSIAENVLEPYPADGLDVADYALRMLGVRASVPLCTPGGAEPLLVSIPRGAAAISVVIEAIEDDLDVAAGVPASTYPHVIAVAEGISPPLVWQTGRASVDYTGEHGRATLTLAAADGFPIGGRIKLLTVLYPAKDDPADPGREVHGPDLCSRVLRTVNFEPRFAVAEGSTVSARSTLFGRIFSSHTSKIRVALRDQVGDPHFDIPLSPTRVPLPPPLRDLGAAPPHTLLLIARPGLAGSVPELDGDDDDDDDQVGGGPRGGSARTRPRVSSPTLGYGPGPSPTADPSSDDSSDAGVREDWGAVAMKAWPFIDTGDAPARASADADEVYVDIPFEAPDSGKWTVYVLPARSAEPGGRVLVELATLEAHPIAWVYGVGSAVALLLLGVAAYIGFRYLRYRAAAVRGAGNRKKGKNNRNIKGGGDDGSSVELGVSDDGSSAVPLLSSAYGAAAGAERVEIGGPAAAAGGGPGADHADSDVQDACDDAVWEAHLRFLARHELTEYPAVFIVTDDLELHVLCECPGRWHPVTMPGDGFRVDVADLAAGGPILDMLQRTRRVCLDTGVSIAPHRWHPLIVGDCDEDAVPSAPTSEAGSDSDDAPTAPLVPPSPDQARDGAGGVRAGADAEAEEVRTTASSASADDTAAPCDEEGDAAGVATAAANYLRRVLAAQEGGRLFSSFGNSRWPGLTRRLGAAPPCGGGAARRVPLWCCASHAGEMPQHPRYVLSPLAASSMTPFSGVRGVAGVTCDLHAADFEEPDAVGSSEPLYAPVSLVLAEVLGRAGAPAGVALDLASLRLLRNSRLETAFMARHAVVLRELQESGAGPRGGGAQSGASAVGTDPSAEAVLSHLRRCTHRLAVERAGERDDAMVDLMWFASPVRPAEAMAAAQLGLETMGLFSTRSLGRGLYFTHSLEHAVRGAGGPQAPPGFASVSSSGGGGGGGANLLASGGGIGGMGAPAFGSSGGGGGGGGGAPSPSTTELRGDVVLLLCWVIVGNPYVVTDPRGTPGAETGFPGSHTTVGLMDPSGRVARSYDPPRFAYDEVVVPPGRRGHVLPFAVVCLDKM